MNGFLLSCGALLVFSWILIFVPTLPWQHDCGFGVPVKDYIAQTGEFAVCIFLLAGIALQAWQEQRRRLAVGLVLCAVPVVCKFCVVTTNRTGLVGIPALLLLFLL